MNENIEFSISHKETELKCSLCKEPLRTEKDEGINKEVIDGSKYFFHGQQCFSRTRDWRTFMVKILKTL